MKIRSILAAAVLAGIAGAPALAQTYQEAEDDAMQVEALAMTVGDLDDMDLVNANGDEIGEVEDVLLENGQPSALAIEFGGFLGMGEKTVIMPLDQVSVQEDKLVTNMTEEDLKTLPEWDD